MSQPLGSLLDIPATANPTAVAVARATDSMGLNVEFVGDGGIELVLHMDGDYANVPGGLNVARSDPAAIERRLPGDPVAVLSSVLWTKTMEFPPLAELEALARQRVDVQRALDATKSLVAGVKDRFVVAVYLTPRGPAVVLAAVAADTNKTRKHMQAVSRALAADDSRVVSRTETIAGLSVETLTASSGPGTKPGWNPFAGPKGIRLLAAAHDGLAIVAVGPGARAVVEDVLRPPRNARRLSDHPGLTSTRAREGGCHACAAVDVTAVLELLTRRLAKVLAETDRAAPAAKHLAALRRVDDLDDVVFGMTMEDSKIQAWAHVPGSVLVPSEETADTVQRTILFLANQGRGEDVAAQIEEFADRTCRCRDLACVKKVQKAMAVWAEANKDVQGTQEQGEAVGAAARRMAKCVSGLVPREPKRD